MCRKTWLMPLAVVAVMLAGASSAEAAKTLYPSQAAARNLNAGAAGWVGSDELGGPMRALGALSRDHQLGASLGR